MIERLAAWYLGRRGRVVLPRLFIGFAVGFATAVKQKGDANSDEWRLIVPKGSRFIALNNSVVLPGETEH